PHLSLVRGHMGKGNLDAAGVPALEPDLMNKIDGQLRRRRRVDGQIHSGQGMVVHKELARFRDQAKGAFSEVLRDQFLGQRLAAVPMDEHEYATTGSAGGDAQE